MNIVIKESAKNKLGSNKDLSKVIDAVRKNEDSILTKLNLIVKKVGNILILL
jgi:hypothetical protein